MQGYKASYILTKNEILFLLSSIPNVRPSFPAVYILNHYLSDVMVSQDAVEGLVYKKLAGKSTAEVIIEPIIDLLVRSALSADRLWIVKCAEIDRPVLVLRADSLYIHIRSYSHIDGAWKITPYQNDNMLLSEFNGLHVLDIINIDSQGNEHTIESDESNTWIKEG